MTNFGRNETIKKARKAFDETRDEAVILEACACLMWYDKNKTKCPIENVPKVGELVAWFRENHAEKIMGTLPGFEFGRSTYGEWVIAQAEYPLHAFGSNLYLHDLTEYNRREMKAGRIPPMVQLQQDDTPEKVLKDFPAYLPIEATRNQWLQARENNLWPKDKPNPIRAVVTAWQKNRILPAKKYTTAIMPRFAGSVIEVTYTDVEAGSVLQPQETEQAFEAMDNQPDLFPPPERRLHLSIPQVQGVKEIDHQGQVSQEIRILHESYLATTGYDIGINGVLVAFEFDYFRDALYPGWRNKRNKQGKRVSFHTVNRDHIRHSLDMTRKAYIEVAGLGPLAPVVCRTPVEKLSRGKDKVVLHIIAPHGTRRGGLIIANTMRQLGFLGGKGSARKYAFYHALVQYWDKYGTQNSSIIWPTRPKKLRDNEGRLINEKGELILNKKGKPETRWEKGEQVYDDKGEKIYERNTDALLSHYPVVSRTELIAFFCVTRWSKAKALLDEMVREKILMMEQVGDGYRFFPSIEHCMAYRDVIESVDKKRR